MSDGNKDSALTGLLVTDKSQEGSYGAVSPNMPAGVNDHPPAMAPSAYQSPSYTPGPRNTYVYSQGTVQYPPLPSGPVPGHQPTQQHRTASSPVTDSNGIATFFAEEDIYLMSPHVKVQYDEVFKEADGANSFAALAEANGLIFKWTQLGVYRFFSIILGILLVFIWGILFALINFTTVFVIQPAIKMTFIILRPSSMLFKAVVRSFLDPMWQSMGLVFSRVAGKFAFNIKGLPKPPETARRAAIEEI